MNENVYKIFQSIDPRSYHVFEKASEYFLFDRATATLCGIDVDLYTAFSLLKSGLDFEALTQAFHKSLDSRQIDRFCNTINALNLKGMFKFFEVDRAAQKEMVASLLDHNSRRVQLLMAQGCNLGCRYCYAWRNGSNQKGTLMTFEKAKIAIDFLVKRSNGRPELMVTFFGGEPLLNLPVIKQVVDYCKSIEGSINQRFYFELITNGTLLDSEVTDYLVKNEFLLFVSIDGDEEMHNYNRPSMDGENKYPVILRNALHANMEYAKAGLPVPKTRANLTRKKGDYFATGDYLYGKGFRNIGISAIEPLNHGDPSPAAMTEDQMDELADAFYAKCEEVIDALIAGSDVSPFVRKTVLQSFETITPASSIRGLSCGVGRNTATVDNKGNIYPCHRYEGMENYIIGNVDSGMDQEKTLQYYNKVNDNAMARCHSCWIRDYCSGGCAWTLSAKDGSLSDPSKRECDRRRRSVENSLWLRQKIRKLAPEWLTDTDHELFESRLSALGANQS